MRYRFISLPRVIVAALLPLTVCVTFAQSTPSSSAKDLNAPESQLGGERGAISLHTYAPAPDGSKGFSRGARFEAGLATPPAFKSRTEWKAHLFECNTDTIVLARYLSSDAPVLTSTKGSIYTFSRFAVLDVIKGDAGTVVGTNIVTYRPGGEVLDAGEVLRVDTPAAPPYKPGDQYLLLLRRDKSATARQYISEDEGTTQVRTGRVFSSTPLWTGITPGTSYSDVKSTFAQVAGLSCK